LADCCKGSIVGKLPYNSKQQHQYVAAPSRLIHDPERGTMVNRRSSFILNA
jgi:hypothetical protein